MSLPAPNLDNRKFQDIVDEVKRQIGLRCPEWTDHNVSDPGVTLIELFAMMTEMTLYRMNQVPERNYVKFLEMLGIGLQPPSPARTDLRFYLSRYIYDEANEEAREYTLAARESVAATVRTENEEAVEFSTDYDIRMVRPRLRHILAMPARAKIEVEAEGEAATTTIMGMREWEAAERLEQGAAGETGDSRKVFAIFGPTPEVGDALYLGFEADVSSNLIELEVDGVQSRGTGLDEEYPALKWEFWNSAVQDWQRLTIVRDTTMGFNRPLNQKMKTPRGEQLTGYVELEMPSALQPRSIAGRRAWWVRCMYTLDPRDLPPRGADLNLKPQPFLKSPGMRSLNAKTIGGTVRASQCSRVTLDPLAQSDGLPGQIFRLAHAPVLALAEGEVALVGPQNMPPNQQEVWKAVDDFAESGPHDRHFVCDHYAGEIRFGPNIPQPDGTTRQHGAVPTKGMTVTLSSYRYGGGMLGNVMAEKISVLKTSIPYISEVINPRRADGGREQETLEHAKMRAREMLRSGERAVTAEDFRALIKKHCTSVGRSYCMQPRRVYPKGRDGQTDTVPQDEAGQDIKPGEVRVLLIPALDPSILVPRPIDLRVSEPVRRDVITVLDERRLLTTILDIDTPEYVYISTDIILVASPQMDTEHVRQTVRDCLNRYIHPLTGGPDGDGWPFRREMSISDIYSQLHAASGVAFLKEVKVYTSRLVNEEEGLRSREEEVQDFQIKGLRLKENQMFCTREHRIIVQPMWAA